MDAIVCQEFGPVAQLSVQPMPEPAPRAGEVLIRIASVGVNFPDALLVRGLYQVKPSFPFVPGIECAGTV
ncbi:MAG TPA: NADPH:quinone oxidoreductase, partial [Gammaproteobacteria bacterium]|nr:NADPH:quinone oxidoreductase [Gammaproteobacteria bacterium]